MSSNNSEKFLTWLFYLVAAAAVIGAAYTFFLVGVPKETNFYSILLLDTNSYSHYAKSSTASFSFAIKNSEESDMLYNIRYFANGRLIGSDNFSVAKGGKEPFAKALAFPGDINYPVKIEVSAEANGKEYSVFYWLRAKE